MSTRLPVLVLLLTLAACDRAGAGGAAGGAKPGAPRKFPVSTAKARTEPLAYKIETTGEVEAEEWVQVAAEVEGVASSPAFKEGDRVDPSKVLVEVDPERYGLVVAQREAALERTEAEVKEKQFALTKREELRGREEGWVPEEEITRLRAQVEAGKAGVNEAKAARDIAKRDLARAQVRSPIEGAIEGRHVTSGQYLKPGALVATIVRTKPVRLRFSLREEEAATVEQGTKVAFTVPAYGDETFAGEVFFVARSADPASRRVAVLARNANDDERLKPGFFARVTITTGGRAEAILLPESAVLATEEGFVAFVVEKEKAAKRRIEIGLQARDGRIEVKPRRKDDPPGHGIAPGDEIIVRGAGNVQDGVDVVIVAEPTKETKPPGPNPNPAPSPSPK